jgi:hypothetical protein
MPLTTSILLKSTSQQMLGCLMAILQKGAEHANNAKIEESVFINARLYPDMLPLSKQVQICCDQVTRAAARLQGVDLPNFPDTETTFAQLIERCRKANAYVQAADSAKIDSRTDAEIEVPIGPEQKMTLTCATFLMGMTLPNHYFHAATAYDILRHNGVVLGKRDFLRAPA